ncbi:leucine-rich repeat serine/threonine-protein kinase 1-like [Diadema setosum]|uniref:leucine-rich repeat serine/threonine-protein kinase 1-like n=1 Tax=Diadema setosum TaxID=31175 RepID=UPI003B3BC72B
MVSTSSPQQAGARAGTGAGNGARARGSGSGAGMMTMPSRPTLRRAPHRYEGSADADFRPDFKAKLLHQAAIYSNASLLQDLLRGSQQKYINEADSYGRTALHAVCAAEVLEKEESVECVRILLEAGADPNVGAKEIYSKYTPLHVAAKDGKLQMVRLLVEYGADLETREVKRLTAVELARINFRQECVQYLRNKQAEREQLQAELELDVLEACSDVRKLEFLLKKLGFSAINKDYKETPLFKAAQGGHLGVVNFLLERGADGRPNQDTKMTALYAACQHGHRDVAETLLKRFPGMASEQTQDMELPLHAAAKEGHASLVKLLLEFDYKTAVEESSICETDLGTSSITFKSYKGNLPFYINQRNINGQTALYLACTAGHAEVVRILLEYQPSGAARHSYATLKKKSYVDVDCYTVLGQTPLHSAVMKGDAEIVALLLRYGADVNLPIKSIQCLFDSDQARDSRKVTEKMYFAEEDSSLLYEACSAAEHNIDIINMLLRQGARDVDDKALMAATLAVHNDIKTSILAHTGVHPDPDFLIGEKPLSKFKSYFLECSQNSSVDLDDSVARSGRGSRDTPTMQRSKCSREDSKRGEHRKGGTPDRRKTVASIKRTVSSHGTFDTAVTIDWHDHNLTDVNVEWLVEAGFRHNPALRHYPTPETGIHDVVGTITRIDISDNSLSKLPLIVFQLPSLQQLNASKNKISRLPDGTVSHDTTTGDCEIDPAECESKDRWNAPLLKRVFLEHNRIASVPPDLFLLSSLEQLCLQNNRLTSMPFEMWMAPKLRTLNLSKNEIEELPSFQTDPTGTLNISCHGDPHMIDDASGGVNKRTSLVSLPASLHPELKHDSSGGKGIKSRSSPTLDETGLESQSSPIRSMKRQPSSGTMSSPESEGAESGSHTPQRRYSFINMKRHRLCSMGTYDVAHEEEENLNVDELSSLEVLDLSHNRLHRIPSGLPCLTPKLNKLLLSHNKITDFCAISKLPAGLTDLELAFNRIKQISMVAPRTSLRGKNTSSRIIRATSTVENPQSNANESCYSPKSSCHHGHYAPLMSPTGSRRRSRESVMIPGLSVSATSLLQVCKHRRHRVLANLRTLDLANNQMTRMELISRTVLDMPRSGTDDDDSDDPTVVAIHGKDNTDDPDIPADAWKLYTNTSVTDTEGTLLFPSLNVLMLSNNRLSEITADIQYMTKLSSFKVDGNTHITNLPPEMGRLKCLYDFNADGCQLVEPLGSMVKTSLVKDVLGYLRSILDDAKPYTRMKLMFVGKAGIGKTTLLNELRRDGMGAYLAQSLGTFAERQGNIHIGGKTLKGTHLSTVGVDVCEWTYGKRKGKHGKVTFSTWDFGGQQEFYATHQYFLTKRSLYLVVFKITDGSKVINELQQWLVNIQARAPNSPVIIVGTHYDIIMRDKRFSKEYWPDLKRTIFDRFINIAHPQDAGLPHVIACVEVSCAAGSKSYNVNTLRDLVYDTAYTLTEGREREPLLMQRVPTSYLALEKAVMQIARDMRAAKREPVLHATEYKAEVMRMMVEQSQISFHDKEELLQATRFLHNNGILLHYEDSMLNDYFFLDPQWLCDTLAKVVTIPEINPDVKKGVMLVRDLHRKFEDSSVKEFIISLLNKFEVAVTYDSKHLLIPSRLPQEGLGTTVIPVFRSRSDSTRVYKKTGPRSPSPNQISPSQSSPTERWNRKAVRGHSPSPSRMHREESQGREPSPCAVGEAPERGPGSMSIPVPTRKNLQVKARMANCASSPPCEFFKDGMSPTLGLDVVDTSFQTTFDFMKKASIPKSPSMGDVAMAVRGKLDRADIALVSMQAVDDKVPGPFDNFKFTPVENLKTAIRRLYILQYIPSGFWSHLISRFLSDQMIPDIINSVYVLSSDVREFFGDSILTEFANEFQWVCWQTGIELKFMTVTVFHVKAIVREKLLSSVFERERRPESVQVLSLTDDPDSCTREVSLSRSGQLEILIPNQSLEVTHKPDMAGSSCSDSVKITTSLEIMSRLLSTIIDLIDTLIENFYPNLCEPLGTTFEGELFITRVVPCHRCWRDYNKPSLDEVDVSEWEFVHTADAEAAVRAGTDSPLLWSSISSAEAQMFQTNTGERSKLCCGLSCSYPRLSDEIPGSVTFKHLIPRRRALALQRKDRIAATIARLSADGDLTLQTDIDCERELPQADTCSELGVEPDAGSEIAPFETGLDNTMVSSMHKSTDMPYGICVYGFLFEELVLQSMRNEFVECPNHGNVAISAISPDVMYADLGHSMLTERSALDIHRLLGSGTFGLVFQGVMARNSEPKRPVAVKMLQPYPPGQGAGNTDRRRYEIDNTKWHRDPLRFSCEAYRTARKELSIINNLDHPHIVPFLGFCRHPMCLILELAPQGALDTKLENFKRVGARLSPQTLQQLVVQVSSAVAYLHGKDIIYRDLKAENVLVWRFPDPYSPNLAHPIKIKLADYGISVTALPSGTKGYGGTPGYMAPEIVQYDGKETYTEKVDCFSFGMFLYELMSLQRPFESLVGKDVGRLSEVIKQLIKDGQRPVLSRKEKSYPTYMLDMLMWCWAQDSRDRPSMEQIKDISRTAEFTNLLEVLSLEEKQMVSCVSATTADYSPDGDTVEGVSNLPVIWMTQNVEEEHQSSVVILNIDRTPSDDTACFTLTVSGGFIQCMCPVADTMWLGLSTGSILVYDNGRFAYPSEVTQLSLPQYKSKPRSAKVMVHIPPLQLVAIAADHEVAFRQEDGNGAPSLESDGFHYVDVGREIVAMSLVLKKSGSHRSYELWCGQTDGYITILDAGNLSTAQVTVCHLQDPLPMAPVTQMVTYDLHIQEHMGLQYVWSYVQPGPIVYKWNTDTKAIENRMDIVSTIATCRSNPKPRGRQSHRPMSAFKSQVNSMCLSGEHLYVGVSCGHLLVLDASSLAPVILLSCHEGPVKFTVPIVPHPISPHHIMAPDDPADSVMDGPEPAAALSSHRLGRPTLITLGKGFNDLIGGYANSPARFTGQERLGWYILLWNMEYFDEELTEGGQDFLDGIVRKKSRALEV